MRTDGASQIVIIGSGIAGLFCAIRLANAGYCVKVITKQRPIDSSTNWAQGGIAAILDKTDGVGLASHIEDTLKSGDGQCDISVVNSVIREASDRIQDLLDIGVNFEKGTDGEFHLAKEGGHSDRRILHSKDATGKEIERALSQTAEEHANIDLMPNTLAIDLIQLQHGNPSAGIAGVWCLDQTNQEVITVQADTLILATGGFGQLWHQTTNPSVATGDGLAMAYRAGARVKNLAYIQFHPTALATKSDRPFLITEAMRGEGGVILDDEGLRKWQLQCKKEGAIISPEPFSFTLKHSQLGSMATRDIVARAIDKQLKITGKTHVYLVTSHLDEKLLNSHFPTIRARLETHGLKLGYDPLPISPAAHYAVGGLEVDEIGRPYNRENGDIYPRLYAIGEVACTGMHGANRLASNSLLEAVVYAFRAAEHIISNPPERYQQKLPNWRADGLHTLSEHGPVVHDKNELRQTMSQEVGIVRRFSRLNRAARRLELLGQEVNRIWIESIPTRPIIELRNLTLVGQLVTKDAIARTENCGLHFNQDLIKE